MQPKSFDIEKLALHDPVAAYGRLLGIPTAPVSFNSVVSFNNFSLQQIPLQAGLDTTIAFRTWIDSLTFDLQCPGLFTGNVFQSLFLAQLKQNPGVSIQMQVQSGPKYLVSQQFTPLQNFVNMFASRWPGGWVLYKQQNILTSFMLTQVPSGDDSGLNAYNITLTFNGWQFLDHTLDEMTGEEAACKLRDKGFNIPEMCGSRY